MEFDEIKIGERYWVRLGADDLYGTDYPDDCVQQVVVLDKNAAHLDIEVKHVDDDDEWILEPVQFHKTRELAQAKSNRHISGCAYDSNRPWESTGSCMPGCPIGDRQTFQKALQAVREQMRAKGHCFDSHGIVGEMK